MFRRPNTPRPAASRPTTDPAGIRFLDDVGAATKPKSPVEVTATTVDPSRKPAPASPSKRGWPIGTISFFTVLLGGLALHETGVWSPPFATVSDEITRTLQVESVPSVVVETFSGSVEVEAGDSDSVVCEATRRASAATEEEARQELPKILVTMTHDAGVVRVTAKRAPGAAGMASASVNVRLKVPTGSKLRMLSPNGTLSSEGVGGPVTAAVANGSIRVRGAEGELTLKSTNGAIECEATSAVIKAETGNGSLAFRGELAAGESFLQTRNGSVRVALPKSQEFRLDAESRNGRVSSDFRGERDDEDEDSKSRSRSRSKRLTATVGDDPQAVLKVRSGNGSIKIDDVRD